MSTNTMHTKEAGRWPWTALWRKSIFFLVGVGLCGSLWAGQAAAASKQSLVSYINSETAVLLAEPRSNAKKITALPRGEEMIVEEWEDGGYCKVRFGESVGFVPSNCLKQPIVIEEYDAPMKGKTNADSVNLRMRNETDAHIVTVLKKGAAVEVFSCVDGWYKVDVTGAMGYIHRDYVDLQEADPLREGYYKRLRMGASGMEVVRLQQALHDLGYYKGDVSGTFGAKTRNAVKEFQAEQGLSASGAAGEETQQMLYGLLP